MEISNHEPATLQQIDEILDLPPDLEQIYLKRKSDGYVGSYEEIQRRFHRLPIVEGWATYGRALREQGAIVAVRYRLPMVNTNVIPKDLAGFVLEHEAIESALDLNSSDTQHPIAYLKIQELGLSNSINVSRPRWNHAFATVRQLRLAQKENKLDEMMAFADELESRAENKKDAFGNQELRRAVYNLITSANV